MNHRFSNSRLLRRPIYKSAGLCAILLIVSFLPADATPVQSNADAYLKDNSDWWSSTRRPDSEDDSTIQKRELSTKHFEILGLRLSEDSFDGPSKKLGEAAVIKRGDGSSGRSQICYRSVDTAKKIYLIFEKGELNDAFYLFTGGPDWHGSDRCVASTLVTSDLATASGLRLGLSIAQVKALLGTPSFARKEKLIYSVTTQKKTSTADLEAIKKQNPGLTDDELHRNYDFYTLIAYVEARFQQDKLVYLAVSETESY